MKSLIDYLIIYSIRNTFSFYLFKNNNFNYYSTAVQNNLDFKNPYQIL